MDFKLILDGTGSSQNYHGDATYRVEQNGVLIITDGEKRRIYGPAAWFCIEDTVDPTRSEILTW